MNKRIRELAEQCELNATLLFNKDKLENFAELIVRECDQYVTKHWDEMEPWMNPGDLLTHFGIEKGE